MILQEYLTRADRNVREGERNVTRQLQVVDDLERNGLDTGEAMLLLLQLDEMLATCIADRNGCGDKSASGSSACPGKVGTGFSIRTCAAK